MQLYTGACVSLVSEIIYERSLAHLTLCAWEMPLSTFSGKPIPVLRTVIVNVEYEQQAAQVPLVIVKGRSELLGRNWFNTFKFNFKGILHVTATEGFF